jgi:hypothetical protein
MDKTKSNGQVGHAVPADSALQPPPTKTPPDPFDQVKALIQQMGQKRYAEGYRRAATVIARSVGQLDGESRTKLSKTLDMLEEELHQAEVAAQ